MVKIRLTRTGARNRPSYRIVVADARSPRDGRFIEEVGHYHPTEGGSFKIREERVLYWLRQGAKPTPTVKALLKQTEVWRKFVTS